MARYTLIIFLTLIITDFCMCNSTGKENPQYTQSEKVAGIALTNITIINSVQPYIKRHKTILIKNGIIEAIGDKAEISIPDNFSKMDMRGKYVIPGLIDGHVHITGRPEKCLEIALRKGITGLRDMGGDGAYLLDVQKAIINGDLMGPDIFFSALVGGEDLIMNDMRVKLSTPPSYKLGEAPWARLVLDTSNIEQIVSDAKDCGATGIKIYSGLSADLCERLADEAKKQEFKVWAHAAVIPATVNDIIRSGVEVISHAAFLLLGENWDPKKDSPYAFDKSVISSEWLADILKTMRLKGVRLDPTLAISLWSINRITDKNRSNELRHLLFEVVKRAYDRGIKISAGTDSPLPISDEEPLMLHKEIEMLVKNVKLQPIDAIIASTINNAEILGIEDTHGSIEIGKIGNLVILHKNPIKNIKNIERVDFVIKDGKIIK